MRHHKSSELASCPFPSNICCLFFCLRVVVRWCTWLVVLKWIGHVVYLLQTYCIPSLLYSCDTWNLSYVMRNMLKFRGTMLFRKSSMHIGMKVSNRSIIALVFLFPCCYPWRICYFGRRCRVVEIWFCADWQSFMMPVSLLRLLNFTLNLTTLFVLVLHILRTAFSCIFVN